MLHCDLSPAHATKLKTSTLGASNTTDHNLVQIQDI